MSSRMDRYDNSVATMDVPRKTRVSKNNSLYETIKTTDLSQVKASNNVKILENTSKKIDIDKIKRYIEENKENTRKRKNVINIENNDKEEYNEIEQTKEYDINSVLEKAKLNREIDYDRDRYKKLRDTQFDILSKINLDELKEAQEKLYKDEVVKEELNTEERTLVDLINTITMKKEETSLLSELMGGETSETTLPIEEEREKSIIKNEMTSKILEEKNNLEKTQELVKLKENESEIDKSFYTSSMSFSKEDFEGFDELEKSVKKNNAFTKILLTLVVLFVIGTLVIITNYVFELGLF